MEHLPSRQAVQHARDQGFGGDAFGRGGQITGLDITTIGIGSGDGQGRHPLADGKALDARTERLDASDQVIARRHRRLDPGIKPRAHDDVGEGHPGRFDRHPRLARPRRGQAYGPPLQGLDAARSGHVHFIRVDAHLESPGVSVEVNDVQISRKTSWLASPGGRG